MAVTCVSCGAEQPVGARFCSSCGAPLVRICASCGTEAAASASFCSACGASLREVVGRATRSEEREERRVVTVLFADLAGSTALGERIDPEDLRVLQGDLFELVNSEVERFGGVSEKFVGDAVMAVFGVPLAHGDDADRAVRAALEVRDRFPAFAGEVRRRHGVDVGLRIGVNTGEVVSGREAVARGELMVTGDAVNVAARLQQRAEPGQVLVGERTEAVTRRAIRYESVGAAPAKGKDSPVPAWEATAVAGLPGTRGVEGLSAPLIGRDDELLVLRALTGRVEREGTPQLVTLLGHAGVGKTRLLTEFVRQLPSATLMQGRCLPYGDGITYWPLAEAAKGYAGIRDSDPVDAALEKLATALGPLVPAEQLAGVVEAVAWTIGLRLPEEEGTDVRARLLDAWRRFLEGIGRERLTVLVIEDVHWASAPLLDLLEQLTGTLADAAVLTLCTARPEFLDTRETWGGGLADSTSIRLLPLPVDEAGRLVDALVGSGAFPAELTERIVARAEGNPFYVEEILQMLIDRGAVERRNGSWVVREQIREIELPDSVHGVIAARVDLLDAASREALRRCSVMGRVFWPPAVGVDDDVIAALGRRGLVTEQPESVIEGLREFAFKHALTHDVAYSTLPRTERRELHRRVGEWLEDVAPGREAEYAELAAYHYDSALEYGDTSTEVKQRAFELALEAGLAAVARVATTSERLLGRAVELAEDDRGRVTALIGLGRAHLTGARFELARERLTEAREGAAALGAMELLAEALGWLSRAAWLSSNFDEARETADAAIDALAGLPESPQLARALARRSQLAMLRGAPEADEHALEAIAVARRVGDGRAEVNARINLLSVRANRGVAPDPGDELEIVGTALEVGAVDEAHRSYVNFLWSAQAYFGLEELDRTLAPLQERLGEVPSAEGLDVYVAYSHATLILVPAGRWDELADVLAQTAPPVRVSGAGMLELELIGGLAMRRGELAGAAGPLGELRRLALESGEPQRIIPMAGVVLPHAALAGDRETLQEVGEAVLGKTDREWVSLPTTAIPRALAAAGEVLLLERVALAFRAQRDRATTPRLEISIATADGLLALAEGHSAAAVEHLRGAVQRERALGWVYRTACLELDLAQALAAAGAVSEAEAVRTSAASVLEPLGCVNAF